MGQRFSELKGFFGAMESRESSLPANVAGNMLTSNNDSNEQILNGSDRSRMGDSSSRLTVDLAVSQSNANGNAEGMDQHFESIYSNCAETSKNEEKNGNMIEQAASLYSCSCPTKRDTVCPDKCKNDVVHPPFKRSEEQNIGSMRRGSTRTLSFVSGKRSRAKTMRSPKEMAGSGNKKKRNNWVLKFNCARLKGGSSCGGSVGTDTDIPEPNVGCESCMCTSYRRTEEHHLGAGVIFEATPRQQESSTGSDSSSSSNEDNASVTVPSPADLLLDMSKFNPEDYPIEDCDERARQERAREIAEGVEPPPGFCPGQHIQLLCPPELTIDNLTALFQTHLSIHSAALTALSQIDVSLSPAIQRVVHTQVDYIHCLVPDLLQITACSFYWGKMDRYEAERWLEGRPEGTFLLRDSAQEEYLFSVSFRKYGRSLHARIEQWNHHFSFDSHDPGVFASPTVCGLIEHYKDPSCCMFFEPMLTIPLHRNFPFPLQHLCRAVVCSKVNYDGINQLHLPKALKGYLKEYHYKQRVRVRRFDLEH
ncbi:hypothetical protein C0J52_05239 [Blattella germanica]|nr:hypothetical protein C0J52_05239 [Blattella germanica]